MKNTTVLGFDNEVLSSNTTVIGTGMKVDESNTVVLGIDGKELIKFNDGQVLIEGHLLNHYANPEDTFLTAIRQFARQFDKERAKRMPKR